MDRYALLSSVCRLRDHRSRRSSSWDRTGGNKDWTVIAPGAKEVLLEEHGPGCIKHAYWTYIEREQQAQFNIFRGLVLRMYWDGSSLPSVEAPLGDFFGVANGQIRPILSLPFTVNAGADRANRFTWGFNCYFPMPFGNGARVEIENQGLLAARIWYHVDYELWSEAPSEDSGRFHALWCREESTRGISAPWEQNLNLTGAGNYTVLNARGDGQFAGYFLTVVNNERQWWGEGDDMIFIDDEPFPPSIHGTGTEEVFGGGASPVREYSGPYTGFHCIENRGGYDYWGTNGMYRFYVQDPIRFRESLRATIEHGHANDKDNDYCSVAFWYQRGINAGLPPLPPLTNRKVNLQDPFAVQPDAAP